MCTTAPCTGAALPAAQFGALSSLPSLWIVSEKHEEEKGLRRSKLVIKYNFTLFPCSLKGTCIENSMKNILSLLFPSQGTHTHTYRGREFPK